MKILNVELGERAYPIRIGHGLLDCAEFFAPLAAASLLAIVTNPTVGALYETRLSASLAQFGRRIITIELPDGEMHKHWGTLNLIFNELLKAHADRKTMLIALGGGVVGDMTGFAAATFMRGIPFVQVPTTLLAQVDSSVGGKTGINHPLGKNMIGAFHQPEAVLADIAVLDTLDKRQLAAGLAEVIKTAAVADEAFLAWLETHMDALNRREPDALTEAVLRSCEIKARVVAADEREDGLRAILNFGHTFGHAIEAGLGYGEWLHGEAVGCGMVMAADLSTRLGLIDEDARRRIEALVKKASLPVRAPAFTAERYINLMSVDKKAEGGQAKFVLLKRIGEAVVSRVPSAELQATLAHTVARPPR